MAKIWILVKSVSLLKFKICPFDLNWQLDLFDIYVQLKQGGSIGLVVHCYMFEPLTESELDHEAAKRAFAFNVAW